MFHFSSQGSLLFKDVDIESLFLKSSGTGKKGGGGGVILTDLNLNDLILLT